MYLSLGPVALVYSFNPLSIGSKPGVAMACCTMHDSMFAYMWCGGCICTDFVVWSECVPCFAYVHGTCCGSSVGFSRASHFALSIAFDRCFGCAMCFDHGTLLLVEGLARLSCHMRKCLAAHPLSPHSALAVPKNSWPTWAYHEALLSVRLALLGARPSAGFKEDIVEDPNAPALAGVSSNCHGPQPAFQARTVLPIVHRFLHCAPSQVEDCHKGRTP